MMFLVLVLLTMASDGMAQCAMCRTTVESTISNGRNNIAPGINTGIPYLLAFPYLMIAGVAYLWFVQSKKEQERQFFLLNLRAKVAKLWASNPK